MKRILITTTCRKADYLNPSGHLYVFDTEKWSVIQQGSIIEPPYREVDPNPRGGFRGGKGIAIYNNQILLANTVGVFRFDQNWELINVITHPSCSGIHDILLDRENNLWITSARNDLLFKFDLDGNMLDYFYFRQNQNNGTHLQWAQPNILSTEDIENGNTDFRDPRTHEISSQDSVHINSVAQHIDGDLLVSLGLVVGKDFSTLLSIKDKLSRHGLWSWIVRTNKFIGKLLSLQKDQHSDLIFQPAKGKSIIIRLQPNRSLTPCFIVDNVHVPSHSVLSRSDGTAIYLNTTNGNIIHFVPENGKIISTTKVSDKFLRGILQFSDNDLMIGSQNKLLWFNLKERAIIKEAELSTDKDEAVFAISEFPNQFALPPISFEEKLGKLVRFDEKEPIFNMK